MVSEIGFGFFPEDALSDSLGFSQNLSLRVQIVSSKRHKLVNGLQCTRVPVFHRRKLNNKNHIKSNITVKCHAGLHKFFKEAD